jgi:hypothetical protein
LNIHELKLAYGCSGHPAFPAPSSFLGGCFHAQLGRNRATGMRAAI